MKVHDKLSKEIIFKEVKERSSKLKVREIFNALPITVSDRMTIKRKKGENFLYCILRLNSEAKETEIKKFTDLELAKQEYDKMEQEILDKRQIQVVLIAIDKVANLKKIYQNFFLDTDKFLKELEKIEKI